MLVLELHHRELGTKLLRVEPGVSCCTTGAVARIRGRERVRLTALWRREGWELVDVRVGGPEPAGRALGGDELEALHVACAAHQGPTIGEVIENLAPVRPGDGPLWPTPSERRRINAMLGELRTSIHRGG
jgi:hypothetical protein